MLENTNVKNLISVTSGKGGVGKTLTTIHLALSAAQAGRRVIIFDGDLGLANVDILLNLRVKYHLQDVIDGLVSFADMMIEGPHGIKVIPSASGAPKLARLPKWQRDIILEQLRDISCDHLIIDTGAGIHPHVLEFNQVAQDVIVVTTPEPHAMADAYGVIKSSCEQSSHSRLGASRIWLLVNRVAHQNEGIKVHGKIAEIAKKFLQVDLNFLGHVPADPRIEKSVLFRKLGEPGPRGVGAHAWHQAYQTLLASADGLLSGAPTRDKDCPPLPEVTR